MREIYVPGGTFTMGRGYCPVAGVHEFPPSFESCPLYLRSMVTARPRCRRNSSRMPKAPCETFTLASVALVT